MRRWVLMVILWGGVGHVWSAYDGGMISPVLSYNVGARAYGMGSAATALAEDTTAVFWNPAGLSRVYRQEVVLYYEQLFQNVSYVFGGYTHPVHRLGVFSGSLLYLGTRFKAYDADLAPLGAGGEMSAYQWVAQVGFGQKGTFYQRLVPWARFFDAGATVKFLGSGVGDVARAGVGLDVGVRYYPHHFGGERWAFLKDMVVGVKLNNLVPPTVKYASRRDWYLWDLNFGVAYRTLHDTLTVAVDASQTLFRKRSLRPRVGAEYRFYKGITVRAGYNGELTFGAGVGLEDFSFDYAFGHNFELGGVHHIAVAYRFGEIVP